MQNVLRAIRSETSIEISYQSLSRPDPVWRRIAPHAIGYDGFRWHVGAWCEIDNVFKDFLFSGICDISGTHPAAVKSAEDADWHSYFEMVIGPHPDFSDSQKAVIADDYGMVDGRIVLKRHLNRKLAAWLCSSERHDSSKTRPLVVLRASHHQKREAKAQLESYPMGGNNLPMSRGL
ncbi:WYL domain-containing protein [Sulfitobacter sp. 1A13421]